ncbi:MAG: hypothetical protein R3E18_09825 [Sphingomonadaceae bacterium]
MGGGNVVVRVAIWWLLMTISNFAPPGNIVANVRRGTGVLVMANDNVVIGHNWLVDNPTAQVMVVAYTQSYEDERYNPYPRNVVIEGNHYERGGYDPQLEGASQLLPMFGGSLPAVLWDGLQDGETPALLAKPGTPGWSLNLTDQGKGLDAAQPGPLEVGRPASPFDMTGIGASAELDERIK